MARFKIKEVGNGRLDINCSSSDFALLYELLLRYKNGTLDELDDSSIRALELLDRDIYHGSILGSCFEN